MDVVTMQIALHTKGEGEILDVTTNIAEAVRESKLKNGIVTIFVPGATGAVTTIEYEPGLLIDLPNSLNRIAPKEGVYEHEGHYKEEGYTILTYKQAKLKKPLVEIVAGVDRNIRIGSIRLNGMMVVVIRKLVIFLL